MGEKVTALETVRAPATTSATTPYEPRDFGEAMRLATVYASSGLLGEVRSNEAAFLIMSTGAELGIPATAALRSIHIVSGKPVLSADLMVAMCVKRTDVCEYFICAESTNTSATYETKRVGVAAAIKSTFTIEDARRAKLGFGRGTGKCDDDSNWSKYPRTMLRKRAAAELARQVYPDITLGLYSDAEEDALRESVDVTPPVQLVTEPVRAPEVQDVPLSVAMDGWMTRLFVAATKDACEAVRKEAKARLAKGMPEFDLLARAYSDRIKQLKTAQPPAAEQQPIDAEVVTIREPDGDDE